MASSPFRATAAPVMWLAIALVAGGAGLALALIAGAIPPLAITAWVLGGLVTFGFVTVFTIVDTSRRTQIGYGSGNAGLATLLYVTAIVVGMAAITVAAINLAFWAGRGF